MTTQGGPPKARLLSAVLMLVAAVVGVRLGSYHSIAAARADLLNDTRHSLRE